MTACMDEASLVRGLQTRDENLTGIFLERYRSLIFHCIGQFEQEASARDDLHQEIVKCIIERLDAGRFDPQKGSLGTWLYRVAWCRCVDLLRKNQGRRQAQVASGAEGVPERPDPGPGPGQIAGESEVASLVRRALVSLNEQERSLLDLRFVQGQTLHEIAKTLHISHEKCKYRLKKASTALRRVILNDLSLEGLAQAEGYLGTSLGLACEELAENRVVL
jgi:RNA polymerase sigma-70 factor, ECF subfamily